MAATLLHLEDTYELTDFERLKKEGLVALCTTAPEITVTYLTSQLFESNFRFVPPLASSHNTVCFFDPGLFLKMPVDCILDAAVESIIAIAVETNGKIAVYGIASTFWRHCQFLRSS